MINILIEICRYRHFNTLLIVIIFHYVLLTYFSYLILLPQKNLTQFGTCVYIRTSTFSPCHIDQFLTVTGPVLMQADHTQTCRQMQNTSDLSAWQGKLSCTFQNDKTSHGRVYRLSTFWDVSQVCGENCTLLWTTIWLQLNC